MGFENVKRGLLDWVIQKSKSNVSLILFTLAISILVNVLFSSNLMTIFMGNIPTLSTAVEAVVFLIFWFIFGMVMGNIERKNFIKFISIYWGVSGLIYAVGLIASRNGLGSLSIISIPIVILNLFPTYGLEYFINSGSHALLTALINITISWLTGVLGYLFGYGFEIIK